MKLLIVLLLTLISNLAFASSFTCEKKVSDFETLYATIATTPALSVGMSSEICTVSSGGGSSSSSCSITNVDLYVSETQICNIPIANFASMCQTFEDQLPQKAYRLTVKCGFSQGSVQMIFDYRGKKSGQITCSRPGSQDQITDVGSCKETL